MMNTLEPATVEHFRTAAEKIHSSVWHVLGIRVDELLAANAQAIAALEGLCLTLGMPAPTEHSGTEMMRKQVCSSFCLILHPAGGQEAFVSCMRQLAVFSSDHLEQLDRLVGEIFLVEGAASDLYEIIALAHVRHVVFGERMSQMIRVDMAQGQSVAA